jgi:uncharacterized protein YkwD
MPRRLATCGSLFAALVLACYHGREDGGVIGGGGDGTGGDDGDNGDGGDDGGDGGGGGTGDSGDDGGDGDNGDGGGTGTGDGGDTGTDDDGGTATGDGGDSGAADQMCERWNQDRADMSEGSWSGSVGSCNPGDISAQGRENALRIMNLYRFLADLPPVDTSATRNQLAQACALLMHANGSLSHSPPQSWSCWSADGAEGAGSSNIAGAPGVAAVDLYMVDPGNPTTMGHRRWILSNSIGPTGLGSTSEYSCMWTLDGSGNAGKTWTAWPPPGPFPLGAVEPSWQSIDETGWTVQSDDIDLSGAQVSVTASGQQRSVSVTTLQGGYGSESAISFIPQGWQTQAGTTYAVQITGISQPIDYEIEVVDCG